MANKILLISNRGVRPNRTGETLFKNKLTKSDHRLRCAEVNPGSKPKKYSLRLVPKGQEQQFLKDEISDANGKPWVFFVHGNNQTLNKNLKKCFELRKLYDVNVIAFSWPSVHHGKVRSVLGWIPIQPNVGRYLTRQLKRKLKQYGKARANASHSAKDLSESLQMFTNALPEGDIQANFVCHSLGHRVLKLSKEHRELNHALMPFDNVLLHQADEDNEGHRAWIDSIDKGDKVVVTTHQKDKILELSNLYNHKTFVNRRLGNVPKPNEPNPPIYKDFTGVKNLSFSRHSMFLTPESENQNVFSFFKPIIGE
ncbi:alpha/beta hydrolase [Vibrio sp. T187]|uniref:alpha/beta hydrolase n=1 Tax=Vibrio TaxID=662 RepID=UPI0010C9B832|nr:MULTISPECIES: alpha/beta hydrolase [Vibrio]MBW3696247.1 alpha/beta hydrolase [Vibrio sp. T187]